jgi:putative transposase
MHTHRKQPRPSTGTRQRSLRCFPSDLTDQEWAILEPVIPPVKEGERPRTTEMRDVLNARFSVDRTGCQWRALPHDVPPWSTVWSSVRTWRDNGT